MPAAAGLRALRGWRTARLRSTPLSAGGVRWKRRASTAAAAPLPVLARAAPHAERTAVVSESGEYTYAELLADSAHLSRTLRSAVREAAEPAALAEIMRSFAAGAPQDLDGARVAFLCPPDAAYVVTLWAIWRAGGVTVPLCSAHPADELRYVLQDSGAELLVLHPRYAETLLPLAAELELPTVDYIEALRDAPPPAEGAALAAHPDDPPIDPDRRAHVVYTSGTTGRPKGVVHTHAAVAAQVSDLVDAWGWSAQDRILHFLPLHHTHGIVNKLCCPLFGAARHGPACRATRCPCKLGCVSH